MIIVTLHRSMLESHKACEGGLRLFDAIKTSQDAACVAAGLAPRRALRLRWTRLAMVWLAKQEPGAWSWMRETGLLPSVSLRGADLRGANLRGAYLGGAYLGGVYLGGADLRGADLRGANLGGADLGGADLGGAYLGGAYLGDAHLGDWERDEATGYARRKAGA